MLSHSLAMFVTAPQGPHGGLTDRLHKLQGTVGVRHRQLRVSPGAGERLCCAGDKLLVLLHHCCAKAATAIHLHQQLP